MPKDALLDVMGIEVYRLRPQPCHSVADLSAADGLQAADQGVPCDVHKGRDAAESPATEKPITTTDAVAELDLVAVAKLVAECELCPLSRNRNRVVFGSGSENADVMFIGEGPGAEEDQQGLPFVGRAGKLLTSMIESIGFDRNEVYICNIVKCRPPKNRDPSSMEAKACAPYLRRQIELIKPKVIVALGRISAQLLLDTELALSNLRRQTYKFKDTPIDLLVTYHPAYLLRKPTEKAKSWEDLWNVRQLLEK